jgi:hypothetical protein
LQSKVVACSKKLNWLSSVQSINSNVHKTEFSNLIIILNIKDHHQLWVREDRCQNRPFRTEVATWRPQLLQWLVSIRNTSRLIQAHSRLATTTSTWYLWNSTCWITTSNKQSTCYHRIRPRTQTAVRLE